MTRASLTSLVWQGTPAGGLVRADYPDQCVVYHRASGKTHFLNTSAVALLELLSARSVDEAAIVSFLAERYPELREIEADCPDTADRRHDALSRYVRGILQRFEDLGLARQAQVEHTQPGPSARVA